MTSSDQTTRLALCLGPIWICIDVPADAGATVAELSIYATDLSGALGEKLAGASVSRDKLTEIAYEALHATDNMIDTEHAGAVAPASGVHAITWRKKVTQRGQSSDKDSLRDDLAQRQANLESRRHLLLLARRVFEVAHDDVATTLNALLVIADRTGELPLRASLNVSQPIGAPRRRPTEH